MNSPEHKELQMTLMIELIRQAASDFDQKSYPNEVYFFLLEKTRTATSAEDIGFALGHLLSWKDGKIRLDENGEFETGSTRVRYKVKQAKENTYGPRHLEIFKSPEFFNWASNIRNLQIFDPNIIYNLQRFNLWSENAFVIPVFLLHCLCPRIFPIIDRWVLLAHTLYEYRKGVSPSSNIKATISNYQAYQKWWLRILEEAGISPLSAQLEQLKMIDSGLWVLGKRAAIDAEKKPYTESSDLEEDRDALNTKEFNTLGSDSTEFKKLAVALRRDGFKQGEAIIKAAEQLKIELKPSYLKYPGSHFDRWRKQGIE